MSKKYKTSQDIERRQFTPNEQLKLYMEVNGFCPKCNAKLTTRKNNKIIKLGELAHIYPLNPTKEHDILSNEERLSEDVNDVKNIIVLCSTCHKLYDTNPTVEEYRDMISLKKSVLYKTNVEDICSSEYIEKGLKIILQNLTMLSKPPIEDLDENYKHVELKKKFDPTMCLVTQKSIENNILNYYNFVNNNFTSLEKSGEIDFSLVCLQIKMSYTKFYKLSKNQEDIYDNMCNWLAKQTKCSIRACCEIIISYFIQKCEVFKEIATTQ